jgi:hypothetical protein
MYYTLLFLCGFFFSGIVSGIVSGTWGFSLPALAQTQAQTQAQSLTEKPAQNCPLSINQRLELQIAEFSWQALLNRPLALWPGFAPQAVALKLTDSNCDWLLTNADPPANSLSLPDIKRVFALSPLSALAEPAPGLDSATETRLTPLLEASQQDLPLFCRPLASAFRAWGNSTGLVSLAALEALNGLSSAQTGTWQRELMALERALQAGDKSLRQEWIQLYLASRSQRLGSKNALDLSEAGQIEADLERILGLESWLCLRQEESLSQSELPEELKHLGLFRNPVALFNTLFDRSQQGLTEIERLRHAGLLQVLLLEQIYPDWQKRIGEKSFGALLSSWSGYTPKQGAQLALVLAQRFPEKQIKAADPHSFEKQNGFLIAIELNHEDVNLRPKQVLGLSAEQFLLLLGSQVQIRHASLWGDLQGLTRVTNLPAGRMRLEFVVPLRSYLQLSPALQAGPACEDLRLETPAFSLWGRCLNGKSDLQGYGYFLRLPS